MRECAVCGCYVPEEQSVCPACGAEYIDVMMDVVNIESDNDYEVCHRRNGTFFIRPKAAPKRRRKASSGQA